MNDDEYSTEMELYGVSPRLIAVIMFLTMLIVPLGYIPEFIGHIFYFHYEIQLYSFFWHVEPSSYFGFRIYLTNIQELLIMLPLTIMHWIFAYWVVRHYQGKSSKLMAALLGLASIIIPLVSSFYWSLSTMQLDIIYPIPIQFIIGLIILWRIEGPEIISPWSGVRLDFSWWKWKRAKIPKKTIIDEDEKEMVEKEEWLEG
jgi:hypothetical protein